MHGEWKNGLREVFVLGMLLLMWGGGTREWAQEENLAPPRPQRAYVNDFYQEGEAFVFSYHDDQTQLRYRYVPRTGSLHDLTVEVGAQKPFWISNYGGPLFWVGGKRIPIWETEPDMFWFSTQVKADKSLEVVWHVRVNTEMIVYRYRLAIRGKTLILQVESAEPNLDGFTLDRSEETQGAEILTLPYLPLVPVLYYQGIFVTGYFDWEKTGASKIEPMRDWVSSSSVAFGQTAYYWPNTQGHRRPLNEKLYLSVSERLEELLPKLGGPPSPWKAQLAGKVLVDLWREEPFEEDAALVRKLAAHGVKDLIVVRHNWQRCGYDDCYPSVMPANPRWGGDEGLKRLSEACREAGYLFILHENYVDVYPNAEAFPKELFALQPDGIPIPAWYNKTTGVQSFLLSPIYAHQVAASHSPLIHQRYQTRGTYLDVSTAVNPSEKVDYNHRIPGYAQFRTTLTAYRELLRSVKNAHHGFVIGEGGHHLLYAQMVDAVVAEEGFRAELGAAMVPLVHFDLREIHPRITSFGVGFYPWFFAQNSNLKWNNYSEEEHYCYMAYEIAFGHAGYVPTPDSLGSDEAIIEFIEKKVNLVGVVHRKIAQARVQEIGYWVAGSMMSVEAALAQKKLRQIHLVYDNGVRVWVNLDSKNNWTVQLDQIPKWVSFSALEGGRRQNFTGRTDRRRFVLPPWGWVVAE